VVWTNLWLREDENLYVTSEKIQGLENTKVADLMSGESWYWGIIAGIFNDHDRKAISKLALLNRDGEDRLISKFNRHGIYTVRPTYRYATETLVDNVEYQVSREWLKMWSLKIPQRVKVFLWRAMRGVLPTRIPLQDRGVPCTYCCPFCETNY